VGVGSGKEILGVILQTRRVPNLDKRTLSRTVSRPFQTPPRYEALRGGLAGCFSRRINLQHRIVYEAFTAEKIVLVLRMWTHYGE
jgi:Txe/YoeB family toxin of toxin-antitoxin system